MNSKEMNATGVNTETATLAGGCFWGMEDLVRRQPGVIDTEVGYAGGNSPDPAQAIYNKVKTGETGHAESLQIVFDATKTNYAEILDFFFRIHDPTTVNRQGNDVGTQYRSAIFTHNSRQNAIAEFMIDLVNKSGLWPRPVVTKVEAFTTFFAAEAQHQDYLEQHPNGYTCHFLREQKSLLDSTSKAQLKSVLNNLK